jgi:hypothetical protein
MNFVSWFAGLIATTVADKVWALLTVRLETQTKLNAITTEAKSLMGELDGAQSEAEKKAILRKIANFSTVSRELL